MTTLTRSIPSDYGQGFYIWFNFSLSSASPRNSIYLSFLGEYTWTDYMNHIYIEIHVYDIFNKVSHIIGFFFFEWSVTAYAFLV